MARSKTDHFTTYTNDTDKTELFEAFSRLKSNKSKIYKLFEIFVRSWVNQFSSALGSSSKTSMFPDLPFSDADRDEYCTKKYGITSRHDWFGINYWGSNVWSSSNIIWSNGLLDPWHGAGILSSEDPDLPTVILNLGAHHLDLRAPNAKDPASVTQARQKEEELIGEILEKSRKKSANKNGYKGQAKKGIKF